MSEIITLKQLCAELKLDPREARERLRSAAATPKSIPSWRSCTSPARRGAGSKDRLGERRRGR